MFFKAIKGANVPTAGTFKKNSKKTTHEKSKKNLKINTQQSSNLLTKKNLECLNLAR